MNISKLNLSFHSFTKFKEVLKSKNYKTFIFDCDGVIWNESVMIQEAIDTIRILHNEGCNVFFLTNKNRSSRKEIFDKIISAGLEMVNKNAVYPSSYIAATYIKQKHPSIKSVYLVGRKGLQIELEESGLKVFGGPEDDNKRLTVDEVTGLKVNRDLNAVVCGSDDRINFYKISYAANVAYRTNLLFGTNFDNNAKVGGVIIPGAYTYISTIETASDVKAQIVAKPNKEALNLILNDHNLVNDRVLMIGDSLRTDIRFANNSNIDSCLVFTGQTSEKDYYDLLTADVEKLLPSPTYLIKDLRI